ncbi:MAG TPA: trypsin-like peptidase domain-containing protein [Anaerolineales bacterium]|jgi:S1-C subfamily serine protease|nr:trypsin-like peptidase domain-containing protein [Anaerolineales bacterium]HQX16023.1 trypsin-like peptidase domain-containing protein [Anaerolineales bacterium]
MTEANTSRLARLRSRVRAVLPFASGVFAALLAVGLFYFLFPSNPMTQTEVNQSIADALASATPRAAFSADVYQIILPSLVAIESRGPNANNNEDDSLGSGVIFNDSGQILTSLHVVDGAAEVRILFMDGSESLAVVVEQYPEMDIAVLQPQVLPQTWAPAVLGNPAAMRIGDEAYAVGHPLGLFASMSAGVISGFDRTFHIPGSNQEIEGLIQFDAAANPGNSGGPLLNRNGHVIGIVTGIVSPAENGYFIGIGFAVPIGAAAGGGGSPPY